MRILIAAVLCSLILFIWGMAAHTVLPLGEMGVRAPTNESAVLAGVKSGATTPGIYILPYLSSEKWGDAAAMAAFAETSEAQPFIYMVVSPPAGDPMQMTPQLIKQYVCVFLASLIVTWVLAATAWGFAARVFGATALGVFAWAVSIAPMWNWYRFPNELLIAGLVEQVIGWLLGGIVIAWWLRRTQPRRF